MKKDVLLTALLLIATLLNLPSCTSVSPPAPAAVSTSCPAPNPLPAAARQLPRSETYSDSVQTLLQQWQGTPTTPAPAVPSAKPITTPSPAS